MSLSNQCGLFSLQSALVTRYRSAAGLTTRRSPWRLTCCAASPPTRLFHRTHSR